MKYRVGRTKSQIANGRKIDYFIRVDPNRVRLYQLAKQNLASRAPASDYRKLLREHLGLHSTDYLTPYLSLRARVKDFDRFSKKVLAVVENERQRLERFLNRKLLPLRGAKEES